MVDMMYLEVLVATMAVVLAIVAEEAVVWRRTRIWRPRSWKWWRQWGI